MTIQLSSEALAQISDKNVKKYVECKLYNSSGTYLVDIPVQNVSYSKSRQFGVNSMNLQIPNIDKEFTSGANKIEQDSIILLIEGYDTATATDKIPTFKGRVKDINHTQAGSQDILNVTVYGELILLQRSDLDKIYIADTEYVEDELLTPVIDNVIATIDEIDGTYVRIYDNNNNATLRTLMSEDVIYVEGYSMYIDTIVYQPLQTDGIYTILFFDGTNSLTVGETIKTLDGNLEATYRGERTYGQLGEDYLIVEDINFDRIKDGTIMKGVTSGNTVTIRSFYYVGLSNFNKSSQKANNILSVNDRVHNGIIDKFRATNTNWAGFKTHKINIKTVVDNIAKEERYDGYEISDELGILKLNQPITIDNKNIYASYYYYPQGLFVEDVITDLVTTDDSLSVNIIEDGKFLNENTYWTISENGITSSDYSVNYLEGIRVTSNTTISGTDYVNIKQNLSLLDGYTYDIKFNIDLIQGNNSSYSIYIDSNLVANGTVSEGVLPVSISHTQSGAGDYDFDIRVTDLESGDIIRINNVEVNYNPAKVNAFTKANLYCKLSVEDGSAGEYTLNGNSGYTPIPRYKNLIEDININSTLIKLNNVTDLESSGYVKIDNEIISYSAISGTDLVIDTRGIDSTDTTSHVMGKRVYQILEADRVWYLPYNNIIPSTEDSTASDYGYTGAIDITSGNFSVSGASFSELFYREGIITTDSVASGVTLQSGVDFTFNQIQSTGIETPYILIDYKKIQTRYDAINEIRSMLAPNFIIDETVRKSGSNYNTYIRGRYLLQNTVADYDLDFITDISYSEPINAYNRVKMFGKLANPNNLMYSDGVAVYGLNDFGTQYLKGVGYKYQLQSGDKYIFSNELNLESSPIKKYGFSSIQRSGRITNWVDYIYGNYNIITSSSSGSFEYNANIFNWDLVRVKYNGVHYFGGANTITSLINGSKYGISTKYTTIYNTYYIDYTSGTFSVGDTINDGTNYGTVKHIIELNENDNYDVIIFVELTRTSDTFSNLASVTNGTDTGTINYISLGGVISTTNFNKLPNPKYYSADIYSVVVEDFNDSVNFDPVQTQKIVYIDGVEVEENVGENRWSEELLELSEGTQVNAFTTIEGGFWGLLTSNIKEYKSYVKKFDSTGVYINNDNTEYNEHINTKLGSKKISAGTVVLEKHDSVTGIITTLYTLKYQYQPGIDNTNSYGKGDRFSQMISNGRLNYYKVNGSTRSALDKAMEDATHVRFYRRYAYDIDFEYYGDLLYIDKVGFDKLNLKPDEVNITVDGEYIINIPDDYSDRDVDLITRLRNNYNSNRDTQVSIISKVPIDDIDLCVIDFGEVKDIKLIDLQAGFLFKPQWANDTAPYDIGFKASIYYSDKDEDYNNVDLDDDFELISTDTEDLDMESGSITTLTESELGEYLKARYLKIKVSTGTEADITEGVEKTTNGVTDTSKVVDYYGAAISSVAVYSSDVIVGEAYVDADVINLYKDTTVYEQLYTQELVDNYAEANLTEFQKDNTTVSINSPIGTHYEMGMTVRLNDTENSIDQNYFVEEVSSQNGATTLNVARYE